MHLTILHIIQPHFQAYPHFLLPIIFTDISQRTRQPYYKVFDLLANLLLCSLTGVQQMYNNNAVFLHQHIILQLLQLSLQMGFAMT